MADETIQELRNGVTAIVPVVMSGARVHFLRRKAGQQHLLFSISDIRDFGTEDPPPRPRARIRPTVLLSEDDTAIANTLAEYLFDKVDHYATALMKKVAKDGRE